MSKSVPMYALDKVKTSISIQAEVFVKLTNRAKERDVCLANYINTMLFAHTHNDPWTEADERMRQKIIAENLKKRQLLKKRKGVK